MIEGKQHLFMMIHSALQCLSREPFITSAIWLMLRLPKIFLSGLQDRKSFSFSLCTLVSCEWCHRVAMDTPLDLRYRVGENSSCCYPCVRAWGQSELLAYTKTLTVAYFLFWKLVALWFFFPLLIRDRQICKDT